MAKVKIVPPVPAKKIYSIELDEDEAGRLLHMLNQCEAGINADLKLSQKLRDAGILFKPSKHPAGRYSYVIVEECIPEGITLVS